ncbi:MAG: hypothetical protein M5U01_22845 [Ardenticatenaceae bacterium]|nr:hypothetical protein [Ardenticatenaceae bacterium]
MSDSSLGRLKINRLSGGEVFHEDGQSAGFEVLDFWRWSTSDLVMNTTRGILAEYIVARALGVSTDRAREEWGAFDLRTDDGLRIEVKSCGYVQSWAQEKLSTIQFVVPKRLGWDPDTNVMQTEARRHADVYVFALLAHKDKATIDPLNLSQWRFWALSTKDLDDRERSQYSITLNSLRSLAGDPVGFADLRATVEQVARRNEADV